MMNDRIEHTEHRRTSTAAERPVAWAGPSTTAPTSSGARQERRA
jgi:hypothetical protein